MEGLDQLSMEHLSSRIRSLRGRKHGMMAKLTRLAGVSRPTVDNILTGSEPSLDKGLALWKALPQIEKELSDEFEEEDNLTLFNYENRNRNQA